MDEINRSSGLISPLRFRSQVTKKRIRNLNIQHVFGPMSTTSLAISNTGGVLATSTVSGEIFIYDNKDIEYFNKEKQHFQEYPERNKFAAPANIHMMQFYPQGERIMFSSSKSGFQIYDSNYGHLEKLISQPVNSHDISSFSNQAAVVFTPPDNSISIVDINTGSFMHKLNTKRPPPYEFNSPKVIAKWSPVDHSNLIVVNQSQIQLWDVRCSTPSPVRVNDEGVINPIMSLSFYKGGHLALTCDSSGFIQLWPDQGLSRPSPLPRAFRRFPVNETLKYLSNIPIVEKHNTPGFFIYHNTRTIVAQCLQTGDILCRKRIAGVINDLVYDEDRENLFISNKKLFCYSPKTRMYETRKQNDWIDLVNI